MRILAAVYSCLFAGALLAASPAAFGAGDVVAGPMVGHVTQRSARIWMQLSVAKPVTITCTEDRGGPVSEVGVDVQGPLPYVCDIPLTNLKPNKDYHIAVKLDGDPVAAGAGVVIRTPPPVGEQATFSVAFGSGLEATGKGTQPLFKAVTATNPQAFFFMGDNVSLPKKLNQYPTTHLKTVRFIAEAYSRQRQQPDLQQLFRTTACYAIWNDRDFGTLGADKNWIFKKEAWTAFTHFWPNPDWGTPANPGCYFTMSLADVDFFMLDSRMYRDPDNDPNRKTMFGQSQLDWLKKGLKQSTATFKVIGCASQMLCDYGQGDTWAHYQPEQADFLKWIFDNKISGVIFVSGGAHGGEISALKPAAGSAGYPLFEVTSSSLGDPAEGNVHRQGAAAVGPQFGTLDFGGQGQHRFVTIHIRDQNGKELINPGGTTIYAPYLK